MNVFVADCETDSLDATKVHVLSYCRLGSSEIKSIVSIERMRKFLTQPDLVLIMHNGIRFDVPTLARLLDIKIKARVIDTLALSWYLYPKRNTHGLEGWGKDVGVEKVEIDNWEDLPIEDYIKRCSEDVRINTLVWEKMSDYLSRLYETDDPLSLPILKYLSFKMEVAQMQEEEGWDLDLEKVQHGLDTLIPISEEKRAQLESVMPPVIKRVVKSPPKKCYKKNGTYSELGAKWVKLALDNGFTEDYRGPIEVNDEPIPPNANSPEQIKSWLFSLGWEPDVYKDVKSKVTGEVKSIPQVKKPNSDELTDSVIALIEDQPEVAYLEGLSVVNHRIGLLKGFLRDQVDGRLKARVQGFTNTLRYKHTEIVNLPKVGKTYGEVVRSCLIPPKGKILCGSDMVSIEDLTKRHWIYPHDPEYVESMSQEGYDPHLYLAVKSEALTEEQAENHKKGLENFKPIRDEYKATNYSATYGIGIPKLAKSMNITQKKAKKLLTDFWAVNWAIRAVADECEVKWVGKDQWLYNPLSKFWYSLRAEKDKFSTLNQGTGVYCFDRLLALLIANGVRLIGNFHDEWINPVDDDEESVEEMRRVASKCINKLNNQLNLNVKLAIDVKFGYNYAEVH